MLLQGWGSTVRHARPACTDRELKGRGPRQLLLEAQYLRQFCAGPYRLILKVHVDNKQLYLFEESSVLRMMFYKM